MEALEKNTARLPNVEIVPAAELVGRSTIECIQSGLYFGNRAALDGLTRQIRERVLPGQPALRSPPAAFSRLFEGDRLFDVVRRDLVLVGLERALALNSGHEVRGQFRIVRSCRFDLPTPPSTIVPVILSLINGARRLRTAGESGESH
jgi:hypothetical protein